MGNEIRFQCVLNSQVDFDTVTSFENLFKNIRPASQDDSYDYSMC